MSDVTVISRNEAVPVTVGNVAVYCHSFRASAVKAVSEETTVNGSSVFASTGIRALRLTFSGRIYDESAPLKFLADMGIEMSGTGYTVTYKGLVFTGCIVQKYEAEDSGKGWTDVSFILVTQNIAEEAE